MKLKLILILGVLLLLLCGMGYVLVPSDHDDAAGLSRALLSDAIVPTKTEEMGAASEVELDARNTTVRFSCAKSIAGKTLVMRGGWSEQFNSEIKGSVSIDHTTKAPVRITARIRIDSLWSEHDQLTEALLTMGFFQPKEHPTALFDGVYRANNTNGDSSKITSGVISGNFELNGITKSIGFPAQIEYSDGTLAIISDFSIERHVFDVRFRESGAFGLLTDEHIANDVAIQLRVKVSLDEASANTRNSEEVVGVPVNLNAQDYGVSDLPGMFTETIPTSQVKYDMVLVPGDPTSGIDSYYLQKHEVTWDEFMPWVQGRDLNDDALMGEQRALKLRPSSPYGSIDRNFGMYRRPALGMSRLSAELYCEWLSKQTGRAYRLPTESEWQWAYVSGGGSPEDALEPEQADRIATYKDNSWDDSIGDWATRKICEREPNELGIYDMAGNVAEWVISADNMQVVRGGHFESPLIELGNGRAVEDISVWNRDYPNEPKSQWWYVNARWVGFRVACDAVPPHGGKP